MNYDQKTIEKLSKELEESIHTRDILQGRLDRIVDITAGIIYILDPHGCFVFINKAVEDILGFTPQELLGKHFSVIMSSVEFERVSREFVLPKFIGKRTGIDSSPKLFDERRTGSRKTKNLEIQLLTKSQSDVRILMGDVTGIIAVEGAYDAKIMEESKDRNAAFMGSQGLIFDITKYKKSEQEKFEIQSRLLKLQKSDALGRLAEGVAHDFNNKLGTILGCAEMIRQSGNDLKDNNTYVDLLITASKHAAELTEKLMAFAINKHHQVEDVSVHVLLNNVIQLLEHTADKKITLVQSFYPKAPKVMGDLQQIQSAMLNIAMNACDAMPLGGTLTFETDVVVVDEAFKKQHVQHKEHAQYVRISLVDTGVGIPDELKPKIFKAFYTTKETGQNLGMGLPSVANCVKVHNGFIEVLNNEKQGTRFDVYLPLNGFFPEPEIDGVLQDKRLLKGSGRILVVDDEPAFLDISTMILADLGYSTQTCANGREAVEYYAEHFDQIDLVIIDVMMPELSGWDCFSQIKRINPRVKAVICTGFALDSNAEAILTQGACGFLQKPFESTKLSQLLSKILTPA